MEWPVFKTWIIQLVYVNDSWEETAEVFWKIEPLIRNVVDIGYSEFIFLFDQEYYFEAAIKVFEENQIQYRTS